MNGFLKSFLIGYCSPFFFLLGKPPFESRAVEQGEELLKKFNRSLFFYKKI
jgi:hypothetical protein